MLIRKQRMYRKLVDVIALEDCAQSVLIWLVCNKRKRHDKSSFWAEDSAEDCIRTIRFWICVSMFICCLSMRQKK